MLPNGTTATSRPKRTPITPAQFERIRARGDAEMAQRSRAAAVVYPLAMLAIGMTTPVAREHPLLFWWALAAMSAAGGLRLVYAFRFERLYSRSPVIWSRAFVTSTFALGLAWGVFNALVVRLYATSGTSFVALLAVTGLAAGALTSLATRKRLFPAYLFVVCAPSAAALFSLRLPEANAVGVLNVVFMAFIGLFGRQLHVVWLESSLNLLALEEHTRELEAAREVAETASRTKSEFLANMSHEIRTPMNGVLGMTELLLATRLEPEQRDFAETARNSALALLGVIDDVLDFSKIEAGRLQLEALEFDPRAVLEEVADLLAPRAQAKGLEIICDVPLDLPGLLHGDPARLRQVLVNLLGNAVKFTGNGEVEVRAEVLELDTASATLRFSVRDTGIGIPEERQRAVFESFTQADGSTSRRFGGTGLGLTISRKLVELMGGWLRLESRPGVGSTFRFDLRFPLAVPAARTGNRGAITDARILLVEDHPAASAVLGRWLGSLGAHVDTVATGEEAIGQLDDSPPGDPYRVAIIDVRLPGIDGEETARRIRANPRHASTKLVWLSGSSASGRERLRAMGFEEFLLKPVRLHVLERVVRGLLDGVPEQPRHSGTLQLGADIRLPVGLRVLLVDDNAVNRKVAARMLEKKNIVPFQVTNGREAVDAWRDRPFDVVLMDVQMPEMDGYEATAEIRRLESGAVRRTRIVAMTAHAMAGDRERCLAAGMDDYISKPVRAESLYAALAGDEPVGETRAA